MPEIETQSRPDSAEFSNNVEWMRGLVDEVNAIQKNLEEYEEKSKEKFAQRNKLLPRERLAHLLDAGSPFLEIGAQAGYQLHDDKDGSGAGGGLIAGIGYVENVRVMVVANNSAIKGGTISPSGLKKLLRIHEICFENRLPLVTLAESGGANLNYAAEVFVEGARAFANQARLSAAGIPQFTIVHGNATAGGAYQPGLSDYVILVKEAAHMFLAGPPLLRAATGEIATEEELGGAEMHAREPGTGEYLAPNDRDAIGLLRELISSVGNVHSRPEQQFEEPIYRAEELLGVVPSDPKVPYDVREILARIADGSKFLPFKEEYDQQTVCGFLKIEGQSCGIIANNGPITPQGAGKAAQFIHLCEQSKRPLLFIHNTTGFQVGTESEKRGVIKQGSKMIQAVANAKVPKISLVVGGSYGAGNYAMCGRGLDPRFIFAWPNSRTAVMGGEQAGLVLKIVTEAKWKKKGVPVDEEKLKKIEQGTKQALEERSTALFGSANLWDDGLIDPRDTRRILSFVLDVCQTAEREKNQPNSWGVGRH